MTGSLQEQILKDLREYGIEQVFDSKEYPLHGYYPVKFILHYLWQEEYLPKLETLLKTCSDTDLEHDGTNALMWAGTYLAYEKLSMLAERTDFIAQHIRDKGFEDKTALHYAAGNRPDSPEAIHLLVEWGADVNAQDKFQWTPMHNAAERDNNEAWAALRKLGAKSTENSEGLTPESLRFRLDAASV